MLSATFDLKQLRNEALQIVIQSTLLCHTTAVEPVRKQKYRIIQMTRIFEG